MSPKQIKFILIVVLSNLLSLILTTYFVVVVTSKGNYSFDGIDNSHRRRRRITTTQEEEEQEQQQEDECCICNNNNENNDGSSSIHLLVISDIQIYFPLCLIRTNSINQEALSECVHNHRGRDAYDDVQYLSLISGKSYRTPEVKERFIQEQIAAIERMRTYANRLIKTRQIKGIINNGDWTNAGLSSQLMEHNRLVGNDKFSGDTIPIFYGLGNRDLEHYYDNNDDGSFDDVESSSSSPQECRINDMMMFFNDQMKHLEERNLIKEFDMVEEEENENVETTTTTTLDYQQKIRRGSFGYTFEMDDYRFIQMHWSLIPRDDEGEFLGSFSNFYCDEFGNNSTTSTTTTTSPPNNNNNNNNNTWTFESIMDWLIQQLETAKIENKPVILVAHSAQGILRSVARQEQFKLVLDESTVFAIISGHLHDFYGYTPAFSIGLYTRSLPTFYVGNPTYEKFLSLELLPHMEGMKVTIQDSARGQECVFANCPTQNTVIVWPTVNLE